VTRFRPGDEVYGDNLALKGGFGEYSIAAEASLTHKPAHLTFEEASTIPQAGRSPCKGPAERHSGAGC
jgi:NADPH:quinone reductase-like Zn-dependent oxidoreductase